MACIGSNPPRIIRAMSATDEPDPGGTPDQLAEAMRMIGWSQRYLAERIGVDEWDVRRMLAGKQQVPSALISRLSGAAAAVMALFPAVPPSSGRHRNPDPPADG